MILSRAFDICIVLFLSSPLVLFAAVSPNVSSATHTYEVIDFLEVYQCAYSTFRIIRPQSFFDLRSAVYGEGAEGCEAPEWLLKERVLLFNPFYPMEVNVSALLVQNDFLPLLNLESSITALNPLNEGRSAYDGLNVYWELNANTSTSADRDWGLALSATPGFLTGLENYQLPRGLVYLHDWYAKAGYKWVEISLGRMAAHFGEAKHGTLLLSESAAPFDMAKFTVRPHILGTPLTFLGPFTFETWVAQLGSSQFISDSYLWAVALGIRPLTWLEIAFLELNQFGGVGAPVLDFNDYLKMFVYYGDEDMETKRNRSFLTHINIWGPSHLAKLYFEFYFSGLSEPARWFGDDISSLLGVWFPKIGFADFRIEYAHTVPGSFQHSFWRQGLSQQGTPIGHPLGPDADGIYFDLGLPEMLSWRSVLGVSYEIRAKSPPPGYLTEYRYGGHLTLQKRWDKLFFSLTAKYVYIQHLFYGDIDDSQSAVAHAAIRYSFL